MGDDAFDRHRYRHHLKLRRESADEAVFDHRGDRPCPVCDTPFDGLIAATDGLTVPEGRDGPVCVAVTDGELLAFVH